jgi:hypothetical protein
VEYAPSVTSGDSLSGWRGSLVKMWTMQSSNRDAGAG